MGYAAGMSRRILVTGAAGFIGARVVRQLAGDKVLALDRRADRLTALKGEFPGLETESVDISDADRLVPLLRAYRPDAVIHLAWYADPRDYLTSHRNLDSLSATTRFIDAVLQAGCRKVVVGGSCAEYEPKGDLLRETDAAKPTTLYGVAKLAAGEISRVLAEEIGAELAWARIFHLHGPGEDERRLIPWVAGQLAAGQPVDLTDGTQVRDHLHVDDVARGLVAMLPPGAKGIFNVCSGRPVTLRSVLEIVGELRERPDLLRFGARAHRAGEVTFLAGDSTKLRGVGWSPRFDLREGLADALRARDLG
jgi:nucleoside-diphosphate-sugar epimerase